MQATSLQVWIVVRVAATFFAGMVFMFAILALHGGAPILTIWNEVEDTIIKIIGAVAALLGAAVPVIHALKSWHDASPEANIERVGAIARDPYEPRREEAQTALADAAASMPTQAVRDTLVPALENSNPRLKVYIAGPPPEIVPYQSQR